MQYQQLGWGTVAISLPNIAMAQSSIGSPFWILGFGVVLLLVLSIYVGIKIYQSLKHDVSPSLKRRV